jgi:glutathionyl-hydroquinone reductase
MNYSLPTRPLWTSIRNIFARRLTSLMIGVYRAGIATSQEAYKTAVHELFDSLDKVEKILTGKDYLVGGQLTEADVRLFPTIVCSLRFFVDSQN